MDEGDAASASFSVTLFRGYEADGVTIIGPVNRPCSVYYYFVAGSATSGTDYVAQNNSVSFGPGITQNTITLQVTTLKLGINITIMSCYYIRIIIKFFFFYYSDY